MPLLLTKVEVGQVYRDSDRGKIIRVLFIATPEKHSVRAEYAACYSGGKLTAIAVERLVDPSRYELIVDKVSCPTEIPA